MRKKALLLQLWMFLFCRRQRVMDWLVFRCYECLLSTVCSMPVVYVERFVQVPLAAAACMQPELPELVCL